jgi:hypothetical protein
MDRQKGMRVRVWNGDQSEYLGEGNYLGEVTVYYIVMPDGSLRSCSNAEEQPPQEMIPPGATVQAAPGNPKIVLDSGEVVYGCQVWWEPAEKKSTGGCTVAAEAEADPWAENYKLN